MGRRLESDCGFDVIFTVSVGRVAGAAMNAILEAAAPDAPLLNVLLVRSNTGLPGSGAVGYLANRYPNLRWLRREGAHEDRRWRELVEQEAKRVYDHWNEVYRLVYGRRLPAADEDLSGKERR